MAKKAEKIYLLCGLVISVLLIATVYIYVHYQYIEPSINKPDKKYSKDIKVVASLEDEITTNSAWCGTMNLVWNQLVELEGHPLLDNTFIQNLNKGTFNKNYISDKDYYLTYGKQTISLKKEIEKNIKEKFNEDSDILNLFQWSNNELEASNFIYTMLVKNFKFNKPFDKLEKRAFKNYSEVEYFGINDKSDYRLLKQVDVLYYIDKDNFAIRLNTTGIDQVLIARGLKGNTFYDQFIELVNNTKNYTGSKTLSKDEAVAIPNIEFNLLKEYKELEGLNLQTDKGEELKINSAVQTIKFDLNNEGGKLKSEAAISYDKTAIFEDEHRSFIVNDEFSLFLKEVGKQLPYFAINIDDISKVQKDVK